MIVKCLKIRKISANSTFIFNECLLVARFLSVYRTVMLFIADRRTMAADRGCCRCGSISLRRTAESP